MRRRTFSLYCLLLFLVGGLVDGRIAVGYLYHNLAHVMLNQAVCVPLIYSSGGQCTQNQAEAHLRRSLVLLPNAELSWRRLGYVLLLNGFEEEAATTWKNVPGIVQELIQWGGQAHHQSETAVLWYKQTVMIAPDLGDGWYYLGRAHEDLGRTDQAFDAYRIGLSQLTFEDVGKSDVSYRLGQVVGQQAVQPDWSMALHYYDLSLSLDDFRAKRTEIDTHYARGQTLWHLESQQEALQEFLWVTSARPSDYWAHVNAGILLWQLERNQEETESFLLRAIEIDPERKWAYRRLAIVFNDMGKCEEAQDMYRRVLDLDPMDETAQEYLAGPCEGTTR